MTKKLQHIFALSEKGAKDLVKAVFWCFVCNLALMFPVGAVLFTVQHLLGCLEGGNDHMEGFWTYVGFALAVLLLLFVLHCLSLHRHLPGECQPPGEPGGDPAQTPPVLFRKP